MELAERRRELGVLNGLFDRARQHRGQIALITGGVACGKTALVNTFADHAVDSGAVLLTATGSRAEQALPLGVMGQLFGGTTPLDQLTARTPPAGVGSTVDSGWDVLAVDQPDAAVLDALCAHLLDLASQQPVVLAIDDVQFADAQSQQALLYLQRRIRSARVLMVLTEWAQPRPRHLPFHSEVARLPYFTRLRLAPLSRSGVAEVLAQQLDVPTGRQLAPAYHQTSGGNPLLVHALIEDYLAADCARPSGLGAEPVVGDAFGQAVLDCLHRWEHSLREVACGLALLGEHACPRLLGRLADLPADSAAQVLDVLTMAGLVHNGGFRHPAARAAVLDSLTPTDLAALHVRVAELLHHEGASATAVAGHLISADQASGPWATAVLCDAARQALADDDATLAAACLDLAHRVCGDDQERAAITALLAQVDWRARPGTANLRLAQLRAAMRAGHLTGSDAMTLVKYLLWHDHAGEAAQTLTTLIEATESVSPQVHAELGLTYHLLSHSHPPLFPRRASVPVPPGPMELLATTGDAWSRAAAALATVLSTGPSEVAISAAEHVLQTCQLTDTTLDALVSALLALVYADRPDRAAPWCEALLEESAARQANTWQALLGNLRAEIAFRQGDLLLAAEHARTALDRMPAEQWGAGIGAPLATLLLATTGMGDHDEAAGLLKRSVPEAMFQTWFGPQYLCARGHYFLATGRLFAALGDFRNCGALMTEWGIDHPAIAAWRTGAAQAHLRLDQPDQARELLTEQLALPGAGVRTRGVSLRLLAALDRSEQGLSLFTEALALLRVPGDRVEQAAALVDLSHAQHGRGEVDQARATAEQAMDLAKSCHAETLCRRLLARAGAHHAGQDGGDTGAAAGLATLSRAEWRVASLAALGDTNRVISRKLGITVSTVEQHLTRVYRKLNVQSRAELPSGLPLQRRTWSEERENARVGVPSARLSGRAAPAGGWAHGRVFGTRVDDRRVRVE
ncbi:helix-turn-helix transcriptional regulator [Goodfellowiella coeruleoviolacea]|uniref:Regulatory protein, luxR family n=1 Tax=Goodfellowiella coeruleoviolacea TaxID=334858 RepID=A0AAE3GHW9_9PSEU|nr:LuxR family transcriptional regulator [Goodfellowiella coeruleoviolacea]MCP2168541.1 regulatory protein, luxR family [Goodfellowiella coeruleoviolacea]